MLWCLKYCYVAYIINLSIEVSIDRQIKVFTQREKSKSFNIMN